MTRLLLREAAVLLLRSLSLADEGRKFPRRLLARFALHVLLNSSRALGVLCLFLPALLVFWALEAWREDMPYESLRQ